MIFRVQRIPLYLPHLRPVHRIPGVGLFHRCVINNSELYVHLSTIEIFYIKICFIYIKIIFQVVEDPPPTSPPPHQPPPTSPRPNTGGQPLSQVGNKHLGAICPSFYYWNMLHLNMLHKKKKKKKNRVQRISLHLPHHLPLHLPLNLYLPLYPIGGGISGVSNFQRLVIKN